MGLNPLRFPRWAICLSSGLILLTDVASLARADEVLYGLSVEPGMTASQVRHITGLSIPDACSANNGTNRYIYNDEQIQFGASGLVWSASASYRLSTEVRDEQTFRRVLKNNLCHSGEPDRVSLLPGYKLQRGNLLIGGDDEQKNREPDLFIWDADWEGKFSTSVRIEDGLSTYTTYTCRKVNRVYWMSETEEKLCPTYTAFCPHFSFGDFTPGSKF